MEAPKIKDCTLYYFVPFPMCQKYDRLDEGCEYTVAVSDGTFVEKDWAEEMEDK